MNVFVLAILVYLLYRFIAGFLIPVIRTTSHVRQQFNQARQDSQTSEAQRGTPNTQHEGTSSPTSKVGEYIDFEEVK